MVTSQDPDDYECVTIWTTLEEARKDLEDKMEVLKLVRNEAASPTDLYSACAAVENPSTLSFDIWEMVVSRAFTEVLDDPSAQVKLLLWESDTECSIGALNALGIFKTDELAELQINLAQRGFVVFCKDVATTKSAAHKLFVSLSEIKLDNELGEDFGHMSYLLQPTEDLARAPPDRLRTALARVMSPESKLARPIMYFPVLTQMKKEITSLLVKRAADDQYSQKLVKASEFVNSHQGH